MNLILIYFAIKYKGDFKKIFQALKDHEEISENDLNNISKKLENKEIQAITLMDEEYPNEFKRLYYPPFVIFYNGNINLLKQEYKITLTGEKDSFDVQKYLNQSLPEVTKRHVLVSNLYKGVDQKISDFFTKENKKQIFVSANGLINPYFANKIKIDNNTLIISEYPENTNLNKSRLKSRNRLVAALSNSLVIYSSTKESGIMNLVSQFLELGKEIYCFPGEFENEEDGNTLLLKQGANLITKIKDIY